MPKAILTSLLAGIIITVLACTCFAEEASTQQEQQVLHTRSVVSMGDTARLQHALTKARRGERVVVSVIGGSITQGAKATSWELRWGDRVAQWWRDRFPKAEIVYVNAGIGATGSDIGAHRAQEHLLKHQPDFVAAEYAVNDGGSKIAGETLEGLTRQVLRQPNHPAMMLLFTMRENGSNEQDAHEPVGRHYGLPMVSFRDAFWPEIEAGRLAWDDIEADEVHPNDRGHALCAECVIEVLERVRATLPADGDLPILSAIPKPLISDTFEHTALLNRDAITPLTNEGWKPIKGRRFGPAWQAETPGSVLEFEVEGTAISVLFYRVKGPMGIAQAQVDDLPPVKMEAWFGADWGGYTPFTMVARDLAPGKHRLRITLLEERNAHSEGHQFQVHAILEAGLRPDAPQSPAE